jgi:hypothetical protein
LLLEDWDNQRGVTRQSRYAGFDVDQKLDFLSALSFYFTVERKSMRFTTHDLETAYGRVCAKFRLPSNQATLVAAELEAHTGIIVASGNGFEFSHLSLQEYLCGYYLVRQPFGEAIARYLHDYPAPVAIAVALSSDPSEWLAQAVSRAGVLDNPQSVRSFVQRLGLEHPLFSRSLRLGDAILKLMAKAGQDSADFFRQLLRDPTVREMAELAALDYVLRESRDGWSVRLSPKLDTGESGRLRLGAALIDRQLLSALVDPAEVKSAE